MKTEYVMANGAIAGLRVTESFGTMNFEAAKSPFWHVEGLRLRGNKPVCGGSWRIEGDTIICLIPPTKPSASVIWDHANKAILDNPMKGKL